MQNDLFVQYEKHINISALQSVREKRATWLNRESVQRFHEAVRSLPPKQVLFNAAGAEIVIGEKGDLDEKEQETLRSILATFIPWRKGPFRIFGEYIDAEWRSDLKFERILPHLDDPKNKIIADVGSNNGYFMFRLAHHKPAGIIAFEPTIRHKILFDFLQGFTRIPNLQFELLGGEHMKLMDRIFDIVLCLGVLYHHPDPVGMLRGIWRSMKPDGQLIVESQGIPGKESHCLFPEKRYGKAPGIWFVPTETALVNWISRSGFKEVEVFYTHEMSSAEQRRTQWMQYESYEDYLDPDDPHMTVEGYPAPLRFYVKARKRMN